MQQAIFYLRRTVVLYVVVVVVVGVHVLYKVCCRPNGRVRGFSIPRPAGPQRLCVGAHLGEALQPLPKGSFPFSGSKGQLTYVFHTFLTLTMTSYVKISM